MSHVAVSGVAKCHNSQMSLHHPVNINTSFHLMSHLPFSCNNRARYLMVWHSGSALVEINEVNLYRARLVLKWVTVSGFNSRCGTFISVCNQSPRSTQPGLPFLVRRNEYQLKSDDALHIAMGKALISSQVSVAEVSNL